MLGCFAEVTSSTMATSSGRAKLAAGVHAHQLWHGWLDELGESTGITDLLVAQETVVLLNTIGDPAIDDAGYAAIRQALEEYGEPYEDVDPATIDGVDADPLSRPLQAMRLIGEGAVDSARLLTALELAHKRAGGTAVDADVVSITHQAGHVQGVVLSSGEKIIGKHVVLAGGARTQALLDQIPELAERIPRLVSGLGVSCIVQPLSAPPQVVLRTPNRSFACGLHLVPRANGAVYLGATNAINFAPQPKPNIDDTTFLLNCAVHQIDRKLQFASIVRLQSGNRPVSLDGFPLIGATSLHGLWLATGTYRDGLHISPLVAAYFADRLQDKRPTGLLDPFNPEREPIQAGTREQIVKDASTHIIASGYERNWTLPVSWPSIIDDLFRDRCLTYTYALSSKYTPPAEVLVALMRAPSDVRDYYRRYYQQVQRTWHQSG
jgi:glycine/D-amino acid oxidase-like deaminating enzyme